MRRILATLAFAVVALSGAAAFAQTDGYRPPYNDRLYNSDDDRDAYRSNAPYVRPYEQPSYRPYDQAQRPYEQQAQRYGNGIRIMDAWYGRERRVCDASFTLKGACEGRQSCEIKAGNELCGDPLPNVVKGLSVTYRCHGRVQHTDQIESRRLGLRCD